MDRVGIPHAAVVPLGAVHQADTSLAGRGQKQDRLLALEFFQPLEEDLQHRSLAGSGPTAQDAEPALVQLRQRLGLLLPGSFLDFGRQLRAGFAEFVQHSFSQLHRPWAAGSFLARSRQGGG